MPWVRFIKDFDFKPKPQVTIAYRAGTSRLVTTPCAAAARAAGKAVWTTRAAAVRRGD